MENFIIKTEKLVWYVMHNKNHVIMRNEKCARFFKYHADGDDYYYYLGGKGRQQLLIEPTVTNLNKLQFTQLQMFCELV